MSRITHSRTCAQSQYLTPVDELSSQERRTCATALDIALSSLRPTTDSFDKFRSFTSRRNHAPPSASHRGQGMSANAPRKQSSRTARIVEVHLAPQVANEDDNPTMDRDPVAPIGGPPGDDGPGSDPGDDDPNDLFNDDEDNDDKVEDQLNQLISNLANFLMIWKKLFSWKKLNKTDGLRMTDLTDILALWWSRCLKKTASSFFRKFSDQQSVSQ